MPTRSYRLAFTVLAALPMLGAWGSAALAHEPELAGAPNAQYGSPQYQPPQYRAPQEPAARFQEPAYQAGDPAERGRGKGGECWARVKYGPQFAPPPTGPEYVWRQTPGPPGSPGPIWCLTVQPFPNQPVMTAAAHDGWIRVMCNDDATAPRIAHLQRRLHEHGYYRGEAHGRYDEATQQAVKRFQHERHIEHYGYLSEETLSQLDAPPPPPPPPPRHWGPQREPTTFDTGVLCWPGKVEQF